MKSLKELNNVERGKLLHDLFPTEIPAFLEFANGMCQTIQEQKDAQRGQWNNLMFSFDLWLSLVKQTEQCIKRYKTKLHNSSRLFADQLFDGYSAIFLAHCLSVYTTIQQHPNRKFALAVDLLFNP